MCAAMTSRRCDDDVSHHAKRWSNPFSIEALIGGKDLRRKTDDEHDDKERSENVGRSRNDFVETEEKDEKPERRNKAAAAEKRSAPNVELDVQRLTRTHLSDSDIISGVEPRKPSLRDDDDDDDDDDDEGLLAAQKSPEGRRDDVTDHHDRQHQQQHRSHAAYLQQFQQLFGRQSMLDVAAMQHPLMRQNMLTGGGSSRLAAACSDAALRRSGLGVSGPSGNPAAAAALFCCPPPSPAAGALGPCGTGIVSQRTGGIGRAADDELVPFYSWLLSRHGAFFNHRFHPAGTSCVI